MKAKAGHARVVEIEANLLESLRDLEVWDRAEDPVSADEDPLAVYASVRHKLRTRGRGLQIDKSHANPPWFECDNARAYKSVGCDLHL